MYFPFHHKYVSPGDLVSALLRSKCIQTIFFHFPPRAQGTIYSHHIIILYNDDRVYIYFNVSPFSQEQITLTYAIINVNELYMEIQTVLTILIYVLYYLQCVGFVCDFLTPNPVKTWILNDLKWHRYLTIYAIPYVTC